MGNVNKYSFFPISELGYLGIRAKEKNIYLQLYGNLFIKEEATTREEFQCIIRKVMSFSIISLDRMGKNLIFFLIK